MLLRGYRRPGKGLNLCLQGKHTTETASQARNPAAHYLNTDYKALLCLKGPRQPKRITLTLLSITLVGAPLSVLSMRV